MRKIFLFLAAMLLAVAVNAETINVSKGENKISAAISSATAGDVLVLEDGEYTEGSTIYLQKALTIKAAEGAAPVVKLTKYIRLYKSVELEGIKFVSNASESNGYCLYLHPGCETVNLEGCEFENFKQSCITSWEDFHLASLTINNCYFHDGIRGAIYCPGASLNNENPANDRSYRTIDEIEITNSTFANFTIVSGWSTSIIDVRQGDLTLDDVDPTIVKIENCTFYDNSTVSTDYADIRVYGSSNTTVTNCIFAHSASYTKRATYLGDGGVVRNCITQNYDKTGDPVYGHHSGPTIKKCQPGDPKFVDAAGGNFTLDATSDAVDYAGEDADGGDIVVTLGASRWWPAAAPEPEEPQVLYLKPGIWYWSGNNEKFAIYAFEDGKEAIWSDYMTLAENETAIWKGTIPAGYTNVIFVRFGKGDGNPDNWYETIAPDWDNGHVWNQTNDLKIEEENDLYSITMTTWEGHSGNCPGEWSKYVYVEPAKFSVSGSMTSWTPLEVFANSKKFENLAAGDYEFKIVTPENAWLGLDDLTPEFRQKELYLSGGNIGFTLAEAGDVTITYIKDEVYKVEGNFVLPVVQIRDIDEAAVVLEVAEDKLTASKTVNIKNAINEFKVVIGNNWVGKKNDDGLYGLHRKWNAVSGLTWDGGNIKLTADVIPGEYTFTWTFATGELTVTFPEIPAPKYYLVGDFTEWATNKVLMVEDEGVFSAAYELNAATEYQFKVLKIDYFNNETYIGAENEENQMKYGNSTDWQLTDVDGHNIKLLTTNEASYTFKFTPTTYKCSVVIPEAATAVENAEAEMKAVKMIENGQMVIIKKGVRYNVLGAQV